MRVDTSRLVGWSVPLACIAFAGIILIRGHSRLMSAGQDLAGALSAEGAAAATRDTTQRETNSLRQAAVAPAKSEEPAFLDGLRRHAASNHVRITRWGSHQSQTVSAETANAAAIDPAIKSIVRIGGELTLNGSYQGIRRFFTELTTSSRFYTFSNVRWSRKNPGVEVTMTLTRYVDSSLAAVDKAPRSADRT